MPASVMKLGVMMMAAVMLALACGVDGLSVHSGNAPRPQPVFNPGPAGPMVRAEPAIINLDLAPEDRWTELCTKFQSSGQAVVDYFTDQLPASVVKLLDVILGDLDRYFGVYGKEMRGISRAFDIDLGIVVGLNLAYELRKIGGPHPNVTNPNIYDGPTACTSLVASNGSTVIHGRNMDWNLPNDLRNLTVSCEFQRGGQTVFKGMCVVGYTGILTGMVPGHFSLSINERLLGGSPIEDALNAIIDGGKAVAHLAREVLETEGGLDFAQAVTILEQHDVVAPVYYTVAGTGPDDGVVITRDRTITEDAWTLPNTAGGPSFFVLNTNYDHWKPDPKEDSRRTYGDKHMAALGQAGASTIEGVLSVLHTWPVGNNQTCQTAIMIPSENIFHAYVVYV